MSETEKKLELEVGKTYLSKAGDKVKIEGAYQLGGFVGSNGIFYRRNGLAVLTGWENPIRADLFAEVGAEELASKPKQGRFAVQSPEGGMFDKIHATLESAKEEAARLAEKAMRDGNHRRFHVLEIHDTVEVRLSAEVVWS